MVINHLDARKLKFQDIHLGNVKVTTGYYGEKYLGEYNGNSPLLFSRIQSLTEESKRKLQTKLNKF